MLKRYFFASLMPILLSAEPSAFERQSGATKNDIKNLQILITKLQQQVDTIQQSQEGVSSLYQTQSTKLDQQISKSIQYTQNLEEFKSQLDAYKDLKEQIDLNAKEIKELKTQIQELNKNLTLLNQSVLNELKQLNAAQTKESQEKKSSTGKGTPKVPTFTKNKNKKAEIYTQAKTFFQQKKYDEARVRFEWFLEIDYKKAVSSFYLGEIAFNNKAYKSAIAYYKESVLANDKASYMPTLLLHTAQSFNAIKDIKNYNIFLDSLISNYPESKEAQNAKKLKTQTKDKK